jgi:inosine-uridine nucleoside N-ribohydrolase
MLCVADDSVALYVDPGIDDAIAWSLALRSTQVRQVLFTTVAGNRTLAMTTINSVRYLADPERP